MNQDKQIEEMARDICEHYNRYGTCYLDNKPCDLKCDEYTNAEYLYKKGYRKASDVAREIADELMKFAFAEIAEERMCCDRAKAVGDPTRYFEGRIHAYELFLLKIEELCESEGADDEE